MSRPTLRKVASAISASALALVLAGTACAEPAPALTNDDLCGTSLLGDEGSPGRGDEAWNRRLEEYFRGGGGLVLRHGRIEHEGPPPDTAIAWFGPEPAGADPESGAASASARLSVERYDVAGVTVIEVRIAHGPFASAAVFVWFAPGKVASPPQGAAVLVSNDAGSEDDHGYFVRSWSNQSTGSATLEWPAWPWSGGPRLAVDVTYKSSRVGVAGSLRALVALDRVPESDPSRIGRFLRDAGIVRAPCQHPNLDPDALDRAREDMAREEAEGVIRSAAEFVHFDATHIAEGAGRPAAEVEVRCPGGRTIAALALYSDAKGTGRRLTSKTTRAASLDDVVYSYDAEGRLRFVRVESLRRDSGAKETLEIWYDETGREAGAKSDASVVRPRPGRSPSAEITWMKEHEAELKKACEPGW